MARKAHFHPGCTGKVALRNFKIAQREARSMNRDREGLAVTAYHCRHCNKFHVGALHDQSLTKPKGMGLRYER